jgi:hypothetical protein
MRTPLLIQAAFLLLASLGSGMKGWASEDNGIDQRKNLFVDDAQIASMQNVERTLHIPDKYAGNPILIPDEPWESTVILQPGTVIYDAQEHIFKMWYNSLPSQSKPDIDQFVCYAVSKDGVHWTKPKLKIVEFHGSKENNIVLKWCSWTLSVIKDMHESDPEKRYKLAYWTWHDIKTKGIWVAFSPDGIHWNVYQDNPVVPAGASGDTFTVMQDPASHNFWMYHKSAIMPVRKISRLVSEDFINWKKDELVLEQDDRDQSDTEFYGLSPFAYGNQYLGFLWVFHAYTQQIDVQLVSSRDGRTWDRSVHRRVFLPLGFMKNGYNGHAFDSEVIMSIAPAVIANAEVWIYYTGYNVKHNANVTELDDSYMGEIGLAKLPLDGFVSLDAGSEGNVVTRPVHIGGSSLHVMASSESLARPGQKPNPAWEDLYAGTKYGDGELRVEIQDEQGNPIPGYSAQECNPIRGKLAESAVSWTSGKDLGQLKGRSVRLKFVLRNAKLFAYSVE